MDEVLFGSEDVCQTHRAFQARFSLPSSNTHYIVPAWPDGKNSQNKPAKGNHLTSHPSLNNTLVEVIRRSER